MIYFRLDHTHSRVVHFLLTRVFNVARNMPISILNSREDTQLCGSIKALHQFITRWVGGRGDLKTHRQSPSVELNFPSAAG